MPISRRKACEHCRLAKAKCSLERVCSRCSNRGLICEYNRATSRVGPYTRPYLVEPERDLPSAGPSIVTAPLSNLFSPSDLGMPSSEFGSFFHENPTLDSIDLANWDSYQINGPREVPWDRAIWNRSETVTDLPFPADLSRHEASDDPASNELPNSMLPWGFLRKALFVDAQPSTSSTVTTEQSIETMATAQCPSQPGRPSSPSDECDPTAEAKDILVVSIYGNQHERFPDLRRGATTEQSLITIILVGQVNNYPRMLMRGSRLPPFIYPQCVLNNTLSHQCTALNGTHQCLPEPLANCAALVQMFYNRNPSNSQLVWKTIYDEQKRLEEQSHAYDVPLLLAAIQAMAIYILIQAQDAETIAKNDVTSLAVTLSDMATRLHFRSLGLYKGDIYQNPDLSQKSWAVRESIRRTINLFYVIRIVLVIQVGTKQSNCCTIGSTPLPCGRDLWDPDATETWAIRLHRYESRMLRNRVLTINDLLGVLDSRKSGNKDMVDPLVQKDLVTWCESLDDLGTLVWMASILELQVR
ncbi:hypothetical protein GGS24DRAFT_512362 [Hypoxylon argillaceum]|nr:hypothetical protein GGS24DRAFT_512362 [Hypoxylon argillaceum]